MKDKLTYIPNDDKQNYPSRWKLLVDKFGHCKLEPNNPVKQKHFDTRLES